MLVSFYPTLLNSFKISLLQHQSNKIFSATNSPISRGRHSAIKNLHTSLGEAQTETMNAERTMLHHYEAFLGDCKVILASQSPRRLEILQLMGLTQGENLEVLVSSFEENLDKSVFDDPGMYAQVNAQYKAHEISQRVFSSDLPQDKRVVVVGADTIVEYDGQILEKPENEDHAFQMLSNLSGSTHLVHTGVAAFSSASDRNSPLFSFYETTRVKFAPLSDTEIWNYIRTGEPMDKSGSYGIQGIGGQMVERLEGCYFNVMGFPMHRFSKALSSNMLGHA